MTASARGQEPQSATPPDRPRAQQSPDQQKPDQKTTAQPQAEQQPADQNKDKDQAQENKDEDKSQDNREQKKGDEKQSDENKGDSANPAAAVADKAKDVTVQAAQATTEVAKQALIKARDWEVGWFTGAYIPKDRKRVPMTDHQRWDIYLTQTLTTPSAYVKRMFLAGIDQARDSPSQWGGGIGGYSERFASREGQFITANSLAALGNAALRYEPRYDRCACSGFWPRSRHAIMRNFLTYDRSEEHLRPQWALYGGAFGGGLVSDAWKPKPRNAFAEGGRAVIGQAGWGSLLNFFIEFAGDINKKIGARRQTRRK
ncbi:MAG TPA: hypothetical protein VGG04_16515 [Candidatus Sulfotelmatobacter sp.]